MEEVEHDAWNHLDEDSSSSLTHHPKTDNPEQVRPSSIPSSSGAPQSLAPALFRASNSFQTIPILRAEDSESSCSPFALRPSAPGDHAFFSTAPPAQPTKVFSQRLNKEYRVLSSSLPGMCLIMASPTGPLL
jgi:ubiquitin-conjugating enzyme E2 O